MKILFTLLILLFSASSFAGFIHPMDFTGSDAQKQEVISYIKQRVKKEYCEGSLDLCQETMLRMMEQENLDAFKKATQANNRVIMDRVIKDYCQGGVDLCNYTTILMMYQENLKASQKQLQW